MDLSEENFDFEESNSVASGEEGYVADEVGLNESFQQDFAGSEEEEEEEEEEDDDDDDDDNVADEKIVVIHATVLDFIKVIIEKGDAKAAFSSSNSTENEFQHLGKSNLIIPSTSKLSQNFLSDSIFFLLWLNYNSKD